MSDLQEILDCEDRHCRNSDPNKFVTNDRDQIKHAIEICQGCPVIQKCYQYAMDRPGIHGVWGGTSFRQRTIRRQRKTNV
jgi:hypothetical protein